MTPSINVLKQRLLARDPVGVAWLSLASPLVAEAMGYAGFDAVVIDAEHSLDDRAVILAQLQALATTPTWPIVRVDRNERTVIKHVLDLGARTVLVPMIETAEEAAEAVAATRYAPAGCRGVGSLHRAGRFGTNGDYLATANDQIAVIVQIESGDSVASAAEIAATPGVDCVFVGPSDLSATLGHIGNPGHRQVQAAISEVARATSAAGKAAGILARTVEEAHGYAAQGFSLIAVGADVTFMIKEAQRTSLALNNLLNGPGLTGHMQNIQQ